LTATPAQGQAAVIAPILDRSGPDVVHVFFKNLIGFKSLNLPYETSGDSRDGQKQFN
jgi:hypothetical protein